MNNLINEGKLIKSQKALDEIKMIACTAIKHGGQSEWNLVLGGLQTNDYNYNRILVASLGCTTNPLLLNTYLSMLTNSTFLQYTPDILQSLASNKVAKVYGLEYVYRQFDSLVKSGVTLRSLVPLLRSISTELEYKMVRILWAQSHIELKLFFNLFSLRIFL